MLSGKQTGAQQRQPSLSFGSNHKQLFVSLQVGPAHNPASLPRLDGLEVYARPRADLVKEAAAVAEAQASEAPSGNLSSNLNLAAISLPGHLVAQKAAQTCSNSVLSQGLLTLTSLHQLLVGEC